MEDTIKKEVTEIIEKSVNEKTAEKMTAIETELKAAKEKAEKLEKDMEMQVEITKKLGEAKKEVVEQPKSISESIIDLFKEKEIKGIKDLRKIEGESHTLKAVNPVVKAYESISNTQYTGTVSRTQIIGDVKFPNEKPRAFLDKVFKGIVENGKNLLLWTVGTFTEVVGYAAELADISTGQTIINQTTATGTEKTRKLAKIAARMKMSAESFEDLPQFTQRLESKLIVKMDNWLDSKMWDGDGVDSTATDQHIYGIQAQSTAFAHANYPDVPHANIGDLADACALQAMESGFKANTVWMHPRKVYEYRHTKDMNGNYIINQLADGTLVMNGLKVVEANDLYTSNNGKYQMLVGDPSLIQLWTKRELELEVEREAKTDSYNIYVYGRNQVLVEDEDQKGLIYVADIATDITNITSTAPSLNVAITSPLNQAGDAILMDEKTA